MKKELQKIYFAELEEGKTYALPIEEISDENAREIADYVKCKIVLFPRRCFNLKINEKL